MGFLHDDYSRIVCGFGIGALLDPPLMFAADVFYGRFSCTLRYPECADVTQAACTCAAGDAFKLYARARALALSQPGSLSDTARPLSPSLTLSHPLSPSLTLSHPSGTYSSPL